MDTQEKNNQPVKHSRCGMLGQDQPEDRRSPSSGTTWGMRLDQEDISGVAWHDSG